MSENYFFFYSFVKKNHPNPKAGTSLKCNVHKETKTEGCTVVVVVLLDKPVNYTSLWVSKVCTTTNQILVEQFHYQNKIAAN